MPMIKFEETLTGEMLYKRVLKRPLIHHWLSSLP